MVWLFAILFAMITGYLAEKKGRSVLGWGMFGFLFAILAIPLIMVMPPVQGKGYKDCCQCGERIKEVARKCKHCGSMV